jgi:hypothetical protein
VELVMDKWAESRQTRHADLLRTLCSIVAELLDQELGQRTCAHCGDLGLDQAPERKPEAADQKLSIAMLFEEFALTPRHVLMLRRRGGFPSPHRERHRLMFWRKDVESWLAAQPDPSRPTDILKRRPGTPHNRVSARRDPLSFPRREPLVLIQGGTV